VLQPTKILIYSYNTGKDIDELYLRSCKNLYLNNWDYHLGRLMKSVISSSKISLNIYFSHPFLGKIKINGIDTNASAAQI